MSYDPVRALTALELLYLRTSGQFTKLRAIIVPQSTVLACKCNETKLDNDAVTEIQVTAITSGSLIYIRNGMTGYVGSAPGLSDLGQVRMKSAGASSVTFARVSGITWNTNVHLTVVDDFGIWGKLPTLQLSTVKMDDDVTYVNQNVNMPPVPVFGFDTAVPLSSGSLQIDATNSYSLNDDPTTITSYVWGVYKNGFPSTTIINYGTISGSSGSMLGIATFAFTQGAGSYDIQLTITDSKGTQATGHRRCYVYAESDPIDQIQVNSMTGDRNSGGWECEITAYANSGSAVRERSKVILFSWDNLPLYSGESMPRYGNVAGIGQAYAQLNINYNNRVNMTGWIKGESIVYNREFSTVKFTVAGPHYWLQQTTGPSTFLESFVASGSSSVPDVWTAIPNLTIDKIAHHFLYWRSTAIEVMDVYPSGVTRIIGGMSASIGSVWEQIMETAQTRMLTYMAADRYGRLFLYQDPQVMPVASRSVIPVIQTLTNEDLMDDVDLQRTVVNPVSLLEVAGLSMASGSTILMFMSRAPGSLIYSRFGANDQNDRLVVTDQTDANMLSGMLYAKRNNEYASVKFEIAQINRMIDIAPAQYVKYTVSPTDTIREVSIDGLTFLPMRIEYRIDKNGVVSVGLEAEKATDGIPGYTVVVPQEPIINIPDPPEPPDYPWIPYPYDPPYPPLPYLPPEPPGGLVCRSGSGLYGPYDTALSGEVLSTSEQGIITPFNGYMRGSSGGSIVSGSYIGGSVVVGGSVVTSWLSANPSRYEISGIWQALEATKAIAAGSFAANKAEIVNENLMTYAESLVDNWYSVYLLDSSGNVIAEGIHDQVDPNNPYVRSGSFYKSGAGSDFYYVQVRAKVREGMPPAGYSGSGLLNSFVLYEALGSGGAGTCQGNESTLIASGGGASIYDKGYHFFGNAYFYNSGRYSFCVGIRLTHAFYASSYGQIPPFLHVYGTVEHQNGAGGFCPLYIDDVSNPFVTVPGDEQEFDFYTHICVAKAINYYGVDLFTRKFFSEGNYFSPTPKYGYQFYNFYIDVVPTYKVDVQSVLLYNVCSQSGA